MLKAGVKSLPFHTSANSKGDVHGASASSSSHTSDGVSPRKPSASGTSSNSNKGGKVQQQLEELSISRHIVDQFSLDVRRLTGNAKIADRVILAQATTKAVYHLQVCVCVCV